MSKQNSSNKYENVHWADNAAKQVLERFPDEKIYTVASGITPSGIIHAGHFREILTSEFVRKALENKGKKTKFIYSWDSYDVFRKVPKNIPQEWEKYLGLPVSKVADPHKEKQSYADYYMDIAEESIKPFNFPIEFQRQHLLQTSGDYADEIKKTLNKREEIKSILNQYRKEPLAQDWFPLGLYCEKCGKDTTTISNYDEQYTLSYSCKCGHKNTINFKKTPIVKLPWRLDWPMRWNHFHVTYEPGGKDHSTPGGSYDTGKEIVKQIWEREAPVYTFYNFVAMKGKGGKISSSSGVGATIDDLLSIYSPEMVLFLFAGTRPNAEMEVSFDIDVIKLYEDFDKLERLYYGLEEEHNEKKKRTLERTYELSIIEGRKIQKELPLQPSFRHLLTIIQANDFNYEKIKDFYKFEIKTEFDEFRLKERFICAKNWLNLYAPEEFKFKINDELPSLEEQEEEIVLKTKQALEEIDEAQELFKAFKQITQTQQISVKEFFTLMYRVLLSKEKGPKLAGFMIENKTKVLKLLDQLEE